MQIAAAGRTCFKLAGCLECEARLGGWGEIGRTAEQPGKPGSDGIEHFAGGLARGETLGVARKDRKPCIPIAGKLGFLQALDLVGELGELASIAAKELIPVFFELPTARAGVRIDVRANARRDPELCLLRPTVAALGKAHFFFTQRLTVSGAAILFVRGTKSDVTVEDNDGWQAGASFELRK